MDSHERGVYLGELRRLFAAGDVNISEVVCLLRENVTRMEKERFAMM